MACRHHGAAGSIKLELAPVDHWRQGKANVQHVATTLNEAEDQRILDRLADRTEIMARHHFRRHAHFMEQRRHTKAEGLDAGEVEFGLFLVPDSVEPPARIILAKSGRFDQRQDFKFERIRFDSGERFGHHVRCVSSNTASPDEECPDTGYSMHSPRHMTETITVC